MSFLNQTDVLKVLLHLFRDKQTRSEAIHILNQKLENSVYSYENQQVYVVICS